MNRFSLLIIFFCAFAQSSIGQSVPNLANQSILSPATQMANKVNSLPIDIYTGLPNIEVPFFSYKNGNNGLHLNISIYYHSKGNQVAETSSGVGLGWFLNAGGIITRIVRGAPDDQAGNGFMYAAAIPADFRSNGDKYYFDSLDAQQDIFQYNFNGRTGKFYIGKNAQIVVVPASKIKIMPTIGTGTNAQRIIGFRIITEDGLKYDFNDAETSVVTTKNADSTLYGSAYSGQPYFSSWSLSRIIAAFNTDTIKLNYTQKTVQTDFAYPQLAFVKTTDSVPTKTISPLGTNSSIVQQISSIVFPDDSRVTFNYNLYGLSQIRVGAPMFKYGFLFDYLTVDGGHDPIKPLLQTITPFTSKEKNKPYSFYYYVPYTPLKNITDTFQNKRDYWGYYNNASNGINSIPGSFSWGANREPDSNSVIQGMLKTYSSPQNGTVTYDYELNDHYPYIKDPHKITVAPYTGYSQPVTLNQVFSSKNQLIFTLDSTVGRTGSVPITGTGNVTVNIKNTTGSITYASYTLSLYDLFYQGRKVFLFTVPNGNYLLDIPAISGTTITGSFPINITYENRLKDISRSAVAAGGVRIKVLTQNEPDNESALSPWIYHEFKYINTDGTSSGYSGEIPDYASPYQETVNFNGITTTSYSLINSDPVNTMDYSQGIRAGYNRVEIYDGLVTRNSGKTVYDFTSLQEVNDGVFTATFPYGYQDARTWGLGLPKRISVYDSTGRLLTKTMNTYSFDSTFFINANFKSIKPGNSYSYINGDPNNAASPVTRTYVAQDYYPMTGRAFLTSSVDTTFQLNGSHNTSYANYTYDTNYNVTKVISSYDRNRGLQLETRYYYPYNYTLAGGIGKLRDSGIITAPVSTEKWITGDSNPRLISGTITDYQPSGNYIKPATIYALQANKPVPQTTIGNFNPALLNRNTSWFIPQRSFIAYDSKGNLLQSKNNQSGNNHSVIMDYGNQYTIATVSNAAVTDIAYSSFEADGTGNWTISSTLRDTTGAITGKKSYNLSNGSITRSGLVSAQTYLITVWSKTGASVNVNGVSLTAVLATQNNWNLYSKLLTGITSITISGSGLIDELRLHPKDANMVTATYNPLIGVSSATDANNTITYNEYDNLNRLQVIRDKDRNILKRIDYSDTSMVISTSPSWAFAKTCRDGINGWYDSTKTDTNPYSDTYTSVVILPGTSGTDYCTCSNYPNYKIVNGICEQAERCTTSSYYSSKTHLWTGTYHYKWSDNSVSPDYTITDVDPFVLGCMMY